MTTVLLSQQSGRHWNGCNSQTPMLASGRAQPSLGAARARESWECAQGLPSGRDCPSCTGTTPALWHSPEGQGEVTPQSTALFGDPGSCRSIGNMGSREEPALLGSTHSLDGIQTTQAAGVRAQSVSWGMNLQSATGHWTQIFCTGYITANSSPAACASPSLHCLQKDSNIHTLYNRLLPFSHGGKQKHKLNQQ